MNLQHAQEIHRKRVQQGYPHAPPPTWEERRHTLGTWMIRTFWIITALRLLARLAENT